MKYSKFGFCFYYRDTFCCNMAHVTEVRGSVLLNMLGHVSVSASACRITKCALECGSTAAVCLFVCLSINWESCEL